jgi:hypothetical protein
MVACWRELSVEIRPLRPARNRLASMHFYHLEGMRFDRAIG